MLEFRALFEVTDRQFVDGVTSVTGVKDNRVTHAIGDERVIAESREDREPALMDIGGRTIRRQWSPQGVTPVRATPLTVSSFDVQPSWPICSMALRTPVY